MSAPKWESKPINVPNYISDKIDMLRKEFLINLSYEDLVWLRSCKSVSEADRVGRQIIKNHWDEF